MESNLHFTVMKQEAVKNLKIKNNGIYLDATLGMGGHTEEISNTKKNINKIICIDNDLSSIELAKIRLKKSRTKIEFICANFKDIDKVIEEAVAAGITRMSVTGTDLEESISAYQLAFSLSDPALSLN